MVQSKVRGAIQIIRLELPLAAALCVLIGEWLGQGVFPPAGLAASGFAIGFFLAASAMITNDYFDLEVDRVNAPGRPLPAGLLTPVEAMALGLVTGLIGLTVAGAVSLQALVFALAVWVLGFLYNARFKAAGLWGNLMVCASVAMTFLLGGLLAGAPWSPTVWIFALIVFTFDLAEEIAGDAMDAEGDRKRGSQSLAIRYGRQTALRVSGALFGLTVAITWLPILLGLAGIVYGMAFAVADGLIVVFLIRLLRSRTPSEGRRAMRALYVTGTLGLLAFLVGSLAF
jgi:geranylgeranylglycerol-phosphate geranylgeranyltransferase